MPMPTPGSSKAELRSWARRTRSQQEPPVLWPILAELPEFEQATHILLYAAMPGEIDVLPLAETPNKRLYLPRCAENRRIAIHAYPCPLVPGPFGIREPDASLPEAAPEVIDLVLVPGLVFSPDGGRVGYGGGYYDRFLPRLRPDCVTIGLTPSALLVPELPLDSWDRRVSFVVTELGIAKPSSL